MSIVYRSNQWEYAMEECRKEPAGRVCPRSIDDLALISVIDGDADANIIAHIRSCSHCGSRMRELIALHCVLSKRLYRALCPSSDELVIYQQGWIEYRRSSTISEHVKVCPHCAADLRLLSEASDIPMMTRSVSFQRLRRVFAHCMQPAGMLSSARLLRGDAPIGQYAYRAENFQIMFDVERVSGHPQRMMLLGLLLLDDGRLGSSRVSASLLCDDVVVNSTMLDALGNFVLDDVVSGTYSLSLRLPYCEILIEAINL